MTSKKDYKKVEFDTDLPALSVWAIDDDAICMDMGGKTHHDLTDQQAIFGLRRLRYKLTARLDALDRELERLVERNEPSGHGINELNVVLARSDRYMREQWPRELDIALARLEKQGIQVNK